MNKNIEKNISLNKALNKTQYNIFYKFADPFKISPNELYKKINAINNVDNNIKYYIYKNKNKNRKIISEDKNSITKRKNNCTINSINNIYPKHSDSYFKRKDLKNKDMNKEKIISNESQSFKKDISINNNKYNIINTPKKSSIAKFGKYIKLSKLNNDFNQIIRGKLDKEVVINQNTEYNIEKNKNNRVLLSEKGKKIPSLKFNNIFDNKNEIYRLIKADNKIFNNCILKKKNI